jgi:phosphopantetheinyl transferase
VKYKNETLKTLAIFYDHILNYNLTELQEYDDIFCENFTVENRKKESLLARYLLNKLTSKVIKKTIQECNFKKDDAGKPFLENYPQLHISITHSKGHVWAAIADIPIGIDFEKIEPDFKEHLKVAFNEKDWNRMNGSTNLIYEKFSTKEAYSKILGSGFTDEPSLIELEEIVYDCAHKHFQTNSGSYILTVMVQDTNSNLYNLLNDNLLAVQLYKG